MFVNGFTKLSTWIQRICVCEWIYEVKHLNPNEFAKSGCMLALIPRILMALGERPSMFPVPVGMREGDLVMMCDLESWVTCVTSVARWHFPRVNAFGWSI